MLVLDERADWRELLERAAAHEGVAGVAPLVQLQAMAATDFGVSGVLASGIDPEFEPTVSILPQHLLSGGLDRLRSGGYGILLGDRLAARLGVNLGDDVTLITPSIRSTLAGFYPRLRVFEVVGMFSYGAELDELYAYIHWRDAARLIKRQYPFSLRVQLEDLFEAPMVIAELAGELNPEPGMALPSQDWTHTHGTLFRAVRTEKLVIGLLLSTLVIVAAFNLLASMIMTVSDRRADIAVLRTIGARRSEILWMFITQGVVLGLVGIVLGVSLGVPLGIWIDSFINQLEQLLGVRLMEAYFIDYFPSQLLWSDVLVVAVLAFILSVLATIYPALRAAREDPAEILSHE